MSFPRVVLFLGSLLLTALCSGSETAFSAASRVKAYHRMRNGGRRAAITTRLLGRPDLFLSTTLVGTNVGMVVTSSLVAAAAGDAVRAWVEPAAVVGTALLILVLAEILPKQAVLMASDRVVDRLAPIVVGLRVVLFPFVLSAEWFSRLLVGGGAPPRIFESREEIRSFLASAGGKDGDLATRAIELGTATAWFHGDELSSVPALQVGLGRGRILAEVARNRSDFFLVYEADGRTLRGYVRRAELARQTGRWRLETLVDALPYFDRNEPLTGVLYELGRVSAPAGVVMGPTGQPEGVITLSRAVGALLGEVQVIDRRAGRRFRWLDRAEVPRGEKDRES